MRRIDTRGFVSAREPFLLTQAVFARLPDGLGNATETALKSRCILVAEDDPILRYTTVTALSHAGYQVLEAPDGLSALEIAQKEAARIDLLVTNVNMPRMSGHELAREIKKLRADVVVLIVSGQHESEFPPEATAHADALLKPVEPVALVQKVQDLLGPPR
jgi:two-component system, cell cycle sensor histidine kinase and response regulator CckA